MATAHRIAVLSGDGIGPEIVAQAVKVLQALRGQGFDFELREAPVGAGAYLLTGTPLPQSTVEMALASDAVLFGAVGDPRFDHLDASLRPERAILGLRRALGLFADLKQVSVPAELAELSPLRAERVAGVDVLVVRELNGDVYTGQPRGMRVAPDGPFAGEREGFDTMRYAEGEVRRIAHVAFKAARRRSAKLCNVDKANVLATSRVWREVVIDVARDYPDVELTHLYADSAAMQLISHPARFDVILAGNLFGDILSDAASVLTGSIGLPASALLGDAQRGMYEAGHGTALDITERDIANPLACIRAAALMLRHSLGRDDLAQRIEAAVTAVLRQGLRTADLAGGSRVVGTTAMGDAVVAALR
ncbi:3-isopropylmalate dehydrogenase [Azohydromonas caseinilytica]|uniref:3-isopropylmalate dehydrogenase n=1 Tax=Azohydromonas caseinilytica TaxID=2728836 RepID=A0A848FJL8_9BURK|nr:3-isopropylmalate dehydrogenase [Azohydromonas caseinilytica]NML19075.1 3-isopropylmalate dehydrogenase [Azohydromonas caseinilytica]